jgi:hypothetical protein
VSKIRLRDPAYKYFNGDMGGVEFENGETKDHVSQRDIDRLGCILAIDIFDGTAMAINDSLIRDHSKKAVVVKASTRGTADEKEAEMEESRGRGVAKAPAKILSHEEVEAIADRKGIQGLREIAEPLNVRGRSIGDLVRGLNKRFDDCRKADGRKKENEVGAGNDGKRTQGNTGQAATEIQATDGERGDEHAQSEGSSDPEVDDEEESEGSDESYSADELDELLAQLPSEGDKE